jgi:hypothetical protein
MENWHTGFGITQKVTQAFTFRHSLLPETKKRICDLI